MLIAIALCVGAHVTDTAAILDCRHAISRARRYQWYVQRLNDAYVSQASPSSPAHKRQPPRKVRISCGLTIRSWRRASGIGKRSAFLIIGYSAAGTNNAGISTPFMVEKRAIPTIVLIANAMFNCTFLLPTRPLFYMCRQLAMSQRLAISALTQLLRQTRGCE